MPETTLADRALLRLSGEDVRGFLQGLVTNDTAALAPERPLWAGLLSPQGKALFDFIMWAEGEDVLLDCEAEAAARPSKAPHPLPPPPQDRDRAGAGFCRPLVPPRQRRRPRPAPPRPRPPLARAPVRARAGWLEHRLRLGVTEGRAELGSDKTLWLECNARELGGVSFTKGCYVGQENTARMNYRSKVNRRLVAVPPRNPAPEPASTIRTSAWP
jgi:folate-binding protein YgfZ